MKNYELMFENSDIEHDQTQDIQIHEGEDGSVILTFSDIFCQNNNILLGDIIAISLDEKDNIIINFKKITQ